jgi:hypothetical protein
MHRTQLAKAQNEKRKKEKTDFSDFRFFFDCFDTAKLFTYSDL